MGEVTQIAVRAGTGITRPSALLSIHKIASFYSGHPSLDDWIKQKALKSEGSSARTYVVCEGQVVVGYYCLATGSVSRNSVPREMRPHGTPNPIPIMIIGRLAVDKHYERRGIGSGMLRDALMRVMQISQSVGCAAILVHAVDQDSCRLLCQIWIYRISNRDEDVISPDQDHSGGALAPRGADLS